MSKNSNLKRVRNVFEGFSFQDDASPVNKDESEPSNKFQRMSSNHTVQSLLESVSRKNSEESPWLETRAASRMDSHEKAKNIAVAIEQRKKTGKPDMTVFSRIPTKGFGLEDVTRLSEEDETAKKKTDLSRILSKSNLIRTSLLNKSVDDLEDYDPVSTFREKIQENRVVERMQRKDLRVNSSSSEVGNRRNRIILDSDEEDEEESRFSNNNGFNHKAEFQRKQTDESAFGEETPQELERTKKLSKLTKNSKQSAAISLLDSDEEVQPKKSSKTKKNKKELTKKVVLVDSDEDQDDGRQNNSDEEEEESTNWRDMSKADIKQKALEIIDKCKGLSKNLRSSLQRWEGRKSDDGKSNDCINLIEIKDVSATTNENSSSADGSSLIKVSDIQILCPDLTLNSYQLVGVNWLKLLYENQMNGVLADDMGLGKTIQTIAFLTYLSKSKQNSCKLPHFIVVPASTFANWENEFHKFAPSMTLIKYHGSQQERQDLRQEIKDMIRHGELDVILSTYTMFERESNKLDRGFIQSLKFNFLVLDEAHSIKNSDSSRYYHLNNLETRYRLLLSGTPVQNNLMELLALLSFLMPNLFLKEHCQILMEVFNWSLGSGERNREGGFNSKEEMKALMDLKSILSPFVLRRLKSDVLNQLSEKRYVLQKIPMNEYQATVYNNIISQYLQKKETDKANFLEALESKDPEKQKGKGRGRKKKDDDDSKKNGLASTNSGVIDLSESPVKSANAPQNVIKGGITATEAKHLFTSLRKAANHPLLLRIHYTTEKVKKIGKIAFQQEYFGKQCNLQQVMNELENNFSDYDLHELCLQFPQYLSNEILDESTLYQSPKMNYLSTLLPQLIQEDHRILLFSQWTRLLDLLEILLNALDLKFLRLDGSTPIKERQRLIDEYSGDTTISVFLLSTKAGGLGINLTAADTVILHDLDFNPENDKQAEDRCYRIGQTKPVTIYKLVTEGTVDEDIYEMGERKSQLSQAVLSNKNNNGESKQQDKEEDVNLISQILAKALNRK